MEKIKRQLRAGITGEVEGIIRVWPINAPNGKNWLVTRNTFNGTHHLGYFATGTEANESAEQERTEAKRSAGAGARWWVENPPQLIQSTSLGRLDSLGRSRALKSQLAVIDAPCWWLVGSEKPRCQWSRFRCSNCYFIHAYNGPTW